MAKPRRKYRPSEPGALCLRESVRRPLLALAGSNAPQPQLEVARVEDVERALWCELPDEILACFANGDDTLPEWGFDLAAVFDHTARARELGCRADLVAVGQNPNGHIWYCVERRGDRQRAVGLVEFDAEENGAVGWHDLGVWLAEIAGLEDEPHSQQPSAYTQLTLWPDVALKPREWRLVV
jgi:hypothetical protein